jgi:hypothetical protein
MPPAWIVLDPKRANRAILDSAGRQQVLQNPRLADLLTAVDVATAGPTSRRPCLKCG